MGCWDYMCHVVEIFNGGLNFFVPSSVEFRTSLTFSIQVAFVYLGMNTQSERVWNYQTRHVLHSSRRLPPARFWSEGGSSLLSFSEVWIGHNIVWITSIVTVLDCSTQVMSYVVSFMMSSMNLYIEYSWASIYTARSSSRTNDMGSGKCSFWGSKLLCGNCSSSASHDVSMSRSFTRSISVLVIVVATALCPIPTHGGY